MCILVQTETYVMQGKTNDELIKNAKKNAGGVNWPTHSPLAVSIQMLCVKTFE